MQTRFERITKELRCLVCQNESIADSNVELAGDLRRQVREMLVAGKSDDAIFKFMTDRYGEFVRFASAACRPKTAAHLGRAVHHAAAGRRHHLSASYAQRSRHAAGRMSTFLIVAAFMAAIAAAIVAVPLLRDRSTAASSARWRRAGRRRRGGTVSAVVELELARAGRSAGGARARRSRHGGQARAAHARSTRTTLPAG